jgi:hypothetical protein
MTVKKFPFSAYPAANLIVSAVRVSHRLPALDRWLGVLNTGGALSSSQRSHFGLYGPEKPMGTPPGARTRAVVTPSPIRSGAWISSAPASMALENAA